MEFSHGIEEERLLPPLEMESAKSRAGHGEEKGQFTRLLVLGLVGRRRETEGICVMGKERKKS